MPRKNRPVWTHSLSVALLLMAPFDLLASMAMDLYLPVVPAMPAILATTPDVVQLTLSLYMVVLGAGQLVFGPLSDRMGRRPVLFGGAVLFGIASFLLAGTTSAALFVSLRVLQALGAAAALVATFATVRDVYADRPEGAVIYSLFGSMLAFVPALGPVLGALISDQFSWRANFILLGVLVGIAALNALPKWNETRPLNGSRPHVAFWPILTDLPFWSYTLGFSAAMGAFFVFFSTAPRVLIDRVGFSQLGFSLVFATVALVMIATTRFARLFVARWGNAGSLARGMGLLLLGAALLATGELTAAPSFWVFIPPMWLIAMGIVFTCSVTANGALQDFGHVAGTATALYYCIESLIVGAVGTTLVVLLPGDTAWPLVAYCTLMALVTLGCRRRVESRDPILPRKAQPTASEMRAPH
ncbi:CmlA/FloR family chloramphenicol efflux MFS transporter [Cystobacter ferrugineus]|uniref:Chloramphenicol efflux MFS transporter n=1 Tax=Cystobacter ferrugineus TaxID=83449 RepID=A0A1L9B1N0_9BACT|nr:CmlA/FloR family chloramphenicol efflux MFS transporter [Cystobacter ferrugineus]OJH36093.1 chloramphenicol efflux MFS transporter [Cystobacter ferrugineus]